MTTALILWEDDAVIMKPFLQLSIDVSRLSHLMPWRRYYALGMLNIKPIYSVGVINSAMLRSAVQYKTAVF